MDPKTQAMGHTLFGFMEADLADGRRFLVDEEPSLADVALYSYTVRAPEGGVPLDAYPRLRDWLARVEALPGFIPMPATPTPYLA
jgi:glutathione S-transferase